MEPTDPGAPDRLGEKPDPRTGALIRQFVKRREALRLSQTEVAGRMGTSQSAIARLEAGEADPRASTLERYATAIDAELVPMVRATFGRYAVPPAWLVAADHLEQWAAEITSQSELAELIRRLIKATAGGISELHFPTGAGVQQEGYDGIATAKHGNTYLPTGRSVWELGTGGDNKRKAEEDLRKRSDDPLGVDPAETTFVFVSLRRWRWKPDSGTWARRKREAGSWRDVRVLDADDLAAWLEMAPGIHYQLSEKRGRFPEKARPLQMWWDEWSDATDPPTSTVLVVAGREREEKAVAEHLAGAPGALTIRAESRGEALAFIAAAIQRLPTQQRDATVPRCLIVMDELGWRHAVSADTSLVLIPLFGGAMVTADVASHHHVLIPIGNEVRAASGAVDLPRVEREAAEAALREMLPERQEARPEEQPCFTTADAEDLSRVARRSVLSLRRRLAVSRELERPAWAEHSDVASVAALTLIGSWHEKKEGDADTVGRLLGRPYAQIGPELRRWSQRGDPLIRRVGNVWYVVDREDVWALLAPQLGDAEIEVFSELVGRVLGAPLPATELAPEDRWRAGLLEMVPKESEILREGLAETLALMGSRSDVVEIAGGHNGQAIADRIIRQLLTSANEDETGRLWASLSTLLPLLAEAAPEEFLNAVDGGPSSERSMVGMFTDSHDRDPLFSSSPHTGLLWALETLAWDPAYLGRVAQVLARLAELDPGGRMAYRPIASLREIFLSWHPQTAASVEERFEVIDSVLERFPGVGWEFLVSLLPQQHGFAMPTHPPRFRDWRPSRKTITHAELGHVVEEITHRILDAVEYIGQRWSSVVKILSSIPPQLRDEALAAIETLDTARLDRPGRGQLRNTLRDEVSRHRKYHNAEWAMPKEAVDRLAAVLDRLPEQGVEDLAWLFTQRPPSLPDVDEDADDWQAYVAAVDDLREEKLRPLHDAHALDGVRALADRVEMPHEVGRILGDRHILTSDKEADLLNELASEAPSRRWLARGFVAGRHRVDGGSWTGPILHEAEDWSPEKRAGLLLGFPISEESWKLAEGFGEETERLYWTEAAAWAAPDEDFGFAAEKLLTYGRPHHAVDLLAHRVQGKAKPDPDLIYRALEMAATTQPIGQLDSSFAHDAGRLLDHLGEVSDVDQDRLLRAEAMYAEALRFTRTPKLLNRRLENDPEMFAEMISWVFKPEGGAAREITKEVERRAHFAFSVLDTWKGIPGRRDDGTIASEKLERWVEEAHRLCTEQGRQVVGEQYIGRALAHAPRPNEGVWPPSEVCRILDRPEFSQVRRGFEIEVYNSRGVHSRGLTDGGIQERALAQRYAVWASQLASRWPRAAETLRRIAQTYRAEAEQEDLEARLRQDRGW